MIFWCHDQDLFCAAWYEIRTLEEINSRTYNVLHDMTFVVRENRTVEEIISNCMY